MSFDFGSETIGWNVANGQNLVFVQFMEKMLFPWMWSAVKILSIKMNRSETETLAILYSCTAWVLYVQVYNWTSEVHRQPIAHE